MMSKKLSKGVHKLAETAISQVKALEGSARAIAAKMGFSPEDTVLVTTKYIAGQPICLVQKVGSHKARTNAPKA